MALRSLVEVPAPAKLNLFLHVVGRRPDGYHLLQSLFVLIEWRDTLHFERRDDGRLQRHDLGLSLPADDLCLRAARRLQAASGTRLGADISIDKQVPSGAGMGGGSSDAAAVLLALNRLWGLDWPRARLCALALELGADVPFFVGGRNALVEGIGERLTPVALAPRRLAVLKPAASIETRAIFTSALLGRSVDAGIIARFAAAGRQGNSADPLRGDLGESGEVFEVDEVAVREARNDLEAAAKAACPQVGEAAGLLEAWFGNSRMTGSGSAVFAVLSSGHEAVARLPALPEGWQGRICRSLAAHPLVGWAAD